MKKIVLALSIFSVILVAGLALDPGINSIREDYSAPPPDSLDKYYPPQAKEPVYLLKMIGLSIPFSGILSDLFEEDMGNILQNFEKFKMEYSEISKLVPEWEKDYPSGPVDELGKALARGNQEEVMAAYERVGQICHDCHVKTMTPVQYKYHWLDFHEIKVKDPLTEEEVNFPRMMQYLEVSFGGIFVDLEQNQKENCQKQVQGFKARFQTFKETCEECHGASERKYYVDEDILKTIDKLELTLAGSQYDPKKALSLLQKIGMESCHKCHLVHGPAALVKLQWKK
jgi:cytochrome c556